MTVRQHCRLTIATRYCSVFSLSGVARKAVELATSTRRYAIHRGLMQFTMDGLARIGHNAIYEPVSRFMISEHLLINGCLENLDWAIEFKKAGRLKCLAIGSTLAPARSDELALLLRRAEHIDVILAPSDYYRRRCIEECPELRSKLATWSCGVDTDYWSPDPVKSPQSNNHCLVYIKRVEQKLVDDVLRTVAMAGLEARPLVYGKYTPNMLKRALQESKFAVFLSPVESQGLAVCQSWACNVATLVWMASKDLSRPYAAPLLTDATGRFFSEQDELLELLSEGALTTSPREWVLNNLTLELQARRLLKICGISKGHGVPSL